MAISGSSVGLPNYVLRLSVIVFMGVMAVGSVLFWRSSLLFASEYQDLPVTHEQLAVKKSNLAKQNQIQKNLLKFDDEQE